MRSASGSNLLELLFAMALIALISLVAVRQLGRALYCRNFASICAVRTKQLIFSPQPPYFECGFNCVPDPNVIQGESCRCIAGGSTAEELPDQMYEMCRDSQPDVFDYWCAQDLS
jgi:hypothetical protein